MEEIPSVVGTSNTESRNKKDERFILVKGSTASIAILRPVEGMLYRVSKRAAKDILEGLKEHGYDAVLLKESKKDKLTAA